MVRYESDLPIDVVEANIATAIHLVVQTQRALDGSRRVSEVVSFSDDRDRGRCVVNPIYWRAIDADEGTWTCAPEWLDDLPLRGVADREEVDAWKLECSLES